MYIHSMRLKLTTNLIIMTLVLLIEVEFNKLFNKYIFLKY